VGKGTAVDGYGNDSVAIFRLEFFYLLCGSRTVDATLTGEVLDEDVVCGLGGRNIDVPLVLTDVAACRQKGDC
jgi:hypothetical protein